MKSGQPLVVEVTRGTRIESSHLVDAVVMDADGTIVSEFGKTDRLIFPRSSVKALQAILLVESGAADKYGLEEKHLALACSSHNAESFQIRVVREMLDRAGLQEACLECGPEMPRLVGDQLTLGASGGVPERIHNNCSGKHTGFLAACTCMDLPIEGYVGISHPFQKALAGLMEEVLNHPHEEENHGIDGCSIPSYAVPMGNLAGVFARFGVGGGSAPVRSRTFERIRNACMNHPDMVAGTERVCTQIMQKLPDRAFVKVGAEGVYAASLPELGIGIAMKARDGNARAVEVAVAKLICDLLPLSESEYSAMATLCQPAVLDRNHQSVGELKVAT